MAHSRLSPSSAKRWVNCAGSVALSARAPEQAPSFAAAEGTVAHDVAERFVTGKIDYMEMLALVGTVVKQEGFDVEITEEMVDGAVEYHDVIKADREFLAAARKPSPIVFKAEARVKCSSADDEVEGTADYLQYIKGYVLFVTDYKFGAGVIVDPEENEQLCTYAVGVMDTEAGWAFDEVIIKIVQPRGRHEDGTVREWKTTTAWLKGFRDRLKAAAARTRLPNAPLAAGDWCRWCPAKPYCPEIHGAVQKQAGADFTVLAPAPGSELEKAESRIPEVRLLPIERLSEMLKWEGAMKALFEAVKDVVRERLINGEAVPGWKLVDGRANRKWIDEAKVVAEFSTIIGVEAMYEKPKLLGPAKLEKLLGKKVPIGHLTFKPDAPKSVARDTDPREASKTTKAQDDFTVIEVDPAGLAQHMSAPIVHRGASVEDFTVIDRNTGALVHFAGAAEDDIFGTGPAAVPVSAGLEAELLGAPARKGPIWP